jgi:hypothetical protein
MKRIIGIFLLFLLFAAASPLAAQEGDTTRLGGGDNTVNIIGAGLILGEPTGLTAKVWLEKGLALDAAVAWSFLDESALYIHSNALYHFRVLDTTGGNFLTPYVGGGAAFRFQDDLNIGLRIPVGISWLLDAAPVEIFAEIAPGVGIIPETDLELGAGIGARYYFPI